MFYVPGCRMAQSITSIAPLASVALLLIFGRAAQAQTTTLSFASLPSAQSWTYESNGIAESSAFAVAGNSLFQTTVGKGPSTFADYALSNFIDTTKQFDVDLVVKVTADEPNQLRTYGFGFAVASPTSTFSFSIENGHIYDRNGIDVAVDTSVFHDYQLVGNFSTGLSRLYIDGVSVATGTTANIAGTNTLYFGDVTPTGGNANAQLTKYVFTNNFAGNVGAPEPGSITLLGLGITGGLSLVGMAARRRRIAE